MRNAAVGTSALGECQDDNHGSVVANLKSLIEHVQASIALVEIAIAREFTAEFCDGNQEAAADIFVLDDVTPPYERAHAALKASDTGPGAALQFILDAKRSGGERCETSRRARNDRACLERDEIGLNHHRALEF